MSMIATASFALNNEDTKHHVFIFFYCTKAHKMGGTSAQTYGRARKNYMVRETIKRRKKL